MDLKVYYQKIREAESSLNDAYPVVVSHETPDGGTAGVKTEVPARVAARMMVEGHARPASAQETAEFRAQQAEAKRIADQIEASQRMQITVVSENDLRTMRSPKSGSKSGLKTGAKS